MTDAPSTLEAGWYAEVLGHEFDLLDWEETLNAPFEPFVERLPDGTLVLGSQAFADLATGQEVRERALLLIERLNGAMRVWRGSTPLRFGGVLRIDEHGRRHETVFGEVGISEMRCRASAVGMTLGPDGEPLPPSPPAPSSPQIWATIANAQDDVAEMLEHLGKADNWIDIYKTIEFAEHLAGGEPRLRKLLGGSAPECKNMRTTANFYRHARTYRPATPTTLADAKPLLDYVVRAVLDHLCGQGRK